METLFIVIPVVALVVAIALFLLKGDDKEYTINVRVHESDDIAPVQAPTVVEDTPRPKRRYKKRKKKATVTTAPVAEIAPVVKKKVGRPRKNN